MYRRILVAYDGSQGATRALAAAVDLARQDRAELIAVGVESHLPHYGATVGEVDEERRFEERALRQLLSEAEATVAGQDVKLVTEMRAGHSAQAILQAARDHDVDLIVVGHSGHSGVWGRFLGGTAEKISRHAPCSVLIVR